MVTVTTSRLRHEKVVVYCLGFMGSDDSMSTTEKIEGWVYVFICDPGKNESFLGLYDEKQDVHFIPAFRSKEEANDCFLNLPREKGKKYELQAVHLDELHDAAKKSDYLVAMVDDEGRIIG